MYSNINGLAPVITGINSGYILGEVDKLKLQKYRPYGIVLRRDNIDHDESHDKQLKTANLRNLVASIKAACDYEPLIWIDQEGGRVQRINLSNVGSANYPAAVHFGKMYDTNPVLALRSVADNYHKITTELLNFGIRGNFSPVADLLQPSLTTEAIGDRSFSCNSAAVMLLALEAFRAIESAGGVGCFKHLPGHGRAIADSHYVLPVVNSELPELEATDFKIMRDIAKTEPKHAMVAHIMYSCIDSDLPSTLSPKMVTFLRKTLGFSPSTLLMTDAMDMKGITSYGSPDELAFKALAAGFNLILDYTGECSSKFYESLSLRDYIKMIA